MTYEDVVDDNGIVVTDRAVDSRYPEDAVVVARTYDKYTKKK